MRVECVISTSTINTFVGVAKRCKTDQSKQVRPLPARVFRLARKPRSRTESVSYTFRGSPCAHNTRFVGIGGGGAREGSTAVVDPRD